MTIRQSTIAAWLDAALIQIAAESYLDVARFDDRVSLINAFLSGSNRPGSEPTQFLRMSPTQAAYFVSRYEVIDHHQNDATGFSATLLRDRKSGQFPLAFRSTEPKDLIDGGDFGRDEPDGADGQPSQLLATGMSAKRPAREPRSLRTNATPFRRNTALVRVPEPPLPPPGYAFWLIDA